MRTEAVLLTSLVSPYSNTTCPRTLTIIASVWCVFRKICKASKRSAEKPSDSGDTCFHSFPGQLHPFSSVYPSGASSGPDADEGAGLVFPKTLLCARTSRAAAIRPHTISAVGKSLRFRTAESYQYTHSADSEFVVLCSINDRKQEIASYAPGC